MSTHATLLSKSPAKATWTSNARTNLRTKKESWPNMLPDRRACARRSMAHLAKMPLLQLPNCQRSFAAEAACSVSCYRAHPSNNYRGCLTNGQRPTRQCIPPWKKCLTSLWPLAVAGPPMSRQPLRRKRTIYRPAGAVSNFVQDRFYACPVRGQGRSSGFFQ
jgi:hypothetical protein